MATPWTSESEREEYLKKQAEQEKRNKQEMRENLEKFFQELTELKQKYGYEIRGCGCCSSPWIEDSQGKCVADDLWFNEGAKKYEADIREEVSDG